MWVSGTGTNCECKSFPVRNKNSTGMVLLKWEVHSWLSVTWCKGG